MRKFLWFAACCILIAPPPVFGQNSSKDQDSGKDGWGPWRYTWHDQKLWSGVPFCSKCIANSGGDSKWEYQFRSRYGQTMDVSELVEHGVDGATANEFRPEAIALKGDALSPVFETVLHGTCEKLRDLKIELKIEVMCVEEHDRLGEGNDPCFQDARAARIQADS